MNISELINDADSIRFDRGRIYGDAYDNMRTTASLVSAYLGISVSADQMAIIYALGKIARLAQTPGRDNRDSYVDGISYLAISGYCAERQSHEVEDGDQT